MTMRNLRLGASADTWNTLYRSADRYRLGYVHEHQITKLNLFKVKIILNRTVANYELKKRPLS